MLTTREMLLLGLWLLPVVLGVAVGLRTGGDQGRVMLFVTGIVAAMYVVVLAGTLRHARRRLRTSGGVPVDDVAGPADEQAADGPGSSGARALELPLLFLLVPAAVAVVVREGVWTVVAVAGLLIAVLSMAAHVHARGADPVPPVSGRE